MKAFDTDPSQTWLFCFTHPDDELSILGWIHRLSEAGVQVFANWTHSNPTREAEARRVAELVGLSQDRLSFMTGRDGDLCDQMPELLPHFQELVARVRPSRIACGAFEQGHLDHDATNFLVNHSYDGPVFEIPFYHTYTGRIQTLNRFSSPGNGESLVLSSSEAELKRTCARMYPSQNIWSVLFWYEVSQRLRGRKTTLLTHEKMRLQGHTNWMVPNHPSKRMAAVEKSQRWQRWVRAVSRFDAASVIEPEPTPA